MGLVHEFRPMSTQGRWHFAADTALRHIRGGEVLIFGSRSLDGSCCVGGGLDISQNAPLPSQSIYILINQSLEGLNAECQDSKPRHRAHKSGTVSHDQYCKMDDLRKISAVVSRPRSNVQRQKPTGSPKKFDHLRYMLMLGCHDNMMVTSKSSASNHIIERHNRVFCCRSQFIEVACFILTSAIRLRFDRVRLLIEGH